MGNVIDASQIKHSQGRSGDKEANALFLKAVEAGDLFTVDKLLYKNISPDVRDEEENTALHLAASTAHASILRALLLAGASTTARNKHGQCPIHLAATVGDPNVVYLLLEIGASKDPDMFDDDLRSPLFMAVVGGHKAASALLLHAGAKPDVKTLQQTTPLHEAVRLKHDDIIQLMLKCNGKGDTRDSTGKSVLMLAIKVRNTDLATSLVKNGGNLDKPSRSGFPALAYAVRTNQKAIVKLLLESGANPNVISAQSYSLSVLHIAVLQSKNIDSEIIDMLLEHGADCSMTGPVSTPFFKVFPFGDKATTDIMLEAVARLDIDNRKHHTPVDYAVLTGDDSLVKRMLARLPSEVLSLLGPSLLRSACSSGHVPVLECLLNAGLPGDTPDADGNSLLMTAITSAKYDAECKALLTCLLNHGADYNASNNNGDTAVDLVIRFRHYGLLETLIKSGASVNFLNNLNETPLLRTVRYGNTRVARTLLEAGATHPDLVELVKALLATDDFDLTKIVLGSEVIKTDIANADDEYKAKIEELLGETRKYLLRS